MNAPRLVANVVVEFQVGTLPIMVNTDPAVPVDMVARLDVEELPINKNPKGTFVKPVPPLATVKALLKLIPAKVGVEVVVRFWFKEELPNKVKMLELPLIVI